MRDRRDARDEDHRREGDRAPGLHADDRRHRRLRRPEPVRQVLWVDDVQLDQEPVEDRRLGVVEPEKSDRGQCDRRRPRQEDEEAENPASAELPHECMGQQARADDHDDLRDHGEEERVPQRTAEDRVVHGVAEVCEPDPLARQRAGLRVGEAQVGGEDERHPDEGGDEQNRRGDEERRENPPTFRDVPEPTMPAPPSGRHHSHVRADSNADRGALQTALQAE